MGWPLGIHAQLTRGSLRFDVLPNSANAPEQFESALYNYAGRYAAVLLAGDCQRLYLDPMGSLATVYAPERGVAGSTSSALPPDAGRKNDFEYVWNTHDDAHDFWIPFGLTSVSGIERLLPNHYLDIDRWETRRHWPQGDIAQATDVEATVRNIANQLQRNIEAGLDRGKGYLGLTAGRDTRMLLACGRDLLDRLELFTLAVPNASGRLDTNIASRIARSLGLSHRVVHYEPPDRDEMWRWWWRTGHCVWGVMSRMSRSVSQLDPLRPFLKGVGGELARPYHWRQGDTESSTIASEDVVAQVRRLCHLAPQQSMLIPRARRWLDELTVSNTLSIWSLLYNEQYNGCYSGPFEYGTAGRTETVWPFCDRKIIELLLSLPSEYRRRMQLEPEIINFCWPELLEIPFNWPVGLQRAWSYFLRRTRALWGRS